MKKNKKLWSWALAGALAVSNLSVVAVPFTSIVAQAEMADNSLKADVDGDDSYTQSEAVTLIPGSTLPVKIKNDGASANEAEIAFADDLGQCTSSNIAAIAAGAVVDREIVIPKSASTGVAHVCTFTGAGTGNKATITINVPANDTQTYGALTVGGNTSKAVNINTGEYLDVTIDAASQSNTAAETILTSSTNSDVTVSNLVEDKINKKITARINVAAGVTPGSVAAVTFYSNKATGTKMTYNVTCGVKLNAVTFDKTSITAEKVSTDDANITLKATINPSDTDETIEFKSSDTNNWTLPGGGATKNIGKDDLTKGVYSLVLTRADATVSVGTTTITAYSTKDPSVVLATCTVKVVDTKSTGLAFKKSSYKVQIGETNLTQTAYFTPEKSNNEGQPIKYESSDTNVADVNEDTGAVDPKGVGSTTITAKATVNGKQLSASYTVNVVEAVQATSLTIAEGSKGTKSTADIGKTFKLNARLTPANATALPVWTENSGGTVCEVDQDGVVKIVAAGKATITCTESGGKFATYDLTVENISMTGASINKESVTMSYKTTGPAKQQLGSNSDGYLKVTVTPADAEIKSVDWATENAGKVTVNKCPGTGLEAWLQSEGIGSSDITAVITDMNGNVKKVTAKVTVVEEIAAKTLSFDKTEVEIEAGKTETLKATIGPSDATATEDSIVWSSNRSAIATAKNGVITAVAEGTAVITGTITNVDGTSVKAKCTVTVVKSTEEDKKAEAIAAANTAVAAAVSSPTAENIQAAKDAVAAAEALGATADELKDANAKIAEAEAEAAKAKADEEAKKKAEEEAAKKAAETAADGSKANTPAPVNTELKDAAGKTTGLKVTNATAGAAEAEFVGPADKDAKNVTVPDTIKDLSGNEYKVTSIASGAFKDSKAKTVTIGKNIKSIDKNAFKDSDIKTVKVKGTKLSKKMAKAFNKLKKGAKVKVSGSNKKKNKKYLNALKNVKNGKIKVK